MAALQRLVRAGLGVAVVAGAASQTEEGQHWLRFGRVGATAAVIALDYKLTELRGHDDFEAVHERSSERLLELFKRSGGLFVKAGQFISTQTFLLPDAYVERCKVLQNQVPWSPYSTVVETFVREFGELPTERFREFATEPLASGSIAQVHRATTHEGDDVVVKVQYPELIKNLHRDVATLEFFVSLASKLTNEYPLGWLINEFKICVPQEIDFQREGQNADMVRAKFAHNPAVVVPEIYWEHSTHRILTMEYVEGIPVNDPHALMAAGCTSADLMTLILDVFCKQAFWHGHTHSDPHPANLLIRMTDRTGKRRPSLVLLDHGLYHQVPDEFRMRYSDLWKSILFLDEPQMRRRCHEFNVDEFAELLSILMTGRPWDAKGGYRFEFTEEDQAWLIGKMEERAKDVFRTLDEIPRDFLLLLRINNYLAALDIFMGTPCDTFTSIAYHCVVAVNQWRWAHEKSLRTLCRNAWEFVPLSVLFLRGLVLRTLRWIQGQPLGVPKPLRKGLAVVDNGA